jgi:osmotically-inducible protein OsmY
MTPSGLLKFGAGAVAGVSLGYLFDPERGRSRRALFRDQARARVAREARVLRRHARYQQGRAMGLRHRFGNASPSPVDDRSLIDRVRSQTLGRVPELAHRMSVDAADGVVTLRGELQRPSDIERAVGAVERTPGVVRVQNLLHLPDEVAPNKADARAVSS